MSSSDTVVASVLEPDAGAFGAVALLMRAVDSHRIITLLSPTSSSGARGMSHEKSKTAHGEKCEK